MTVEETFAEWQALKAINDERLAALQTQKLRLDVNDLIRQSWLEHILEAVGGPEAVVRCRLDTQRMISGAIDGAEAQINRAKLLAPGNGAP